MKIFSRRGSAAAALPFGAGLLAVALLAFNLVGTAGASPNLTETDNLQLHRGVLVAPSTGAVYLAAPDGAIDALDLSTGNVVWRTDAAALPLLVDGKTLVAQAEPERAGEMTVATFDLDGTGVPRHLTRVELPSHVQAQVTKSLRTSFEARAETVGDQVELTWTSQTGPAKGISPMVKDGLEGPVDARSAAPKARPTKLSDAGAVLLDPSNGALEAAPARKAAESTYGPVLLELAQGTGLTGIEGRQFLSADGAYVLASARRAGAPLQSRYQWTIYDRASGESVGAVTMPVSARPFVVQDGTLVLVTPPQTFRKDGDWSVETFAVRGIDLVSGAERWKRTVRDFEHSGPMPH